jgi:FAD/FMN-containing dehydrogenase
VSTGDGVDYWDVKQSSLKPALRVEPSNAQEVSEILKILVEENCHFAIKSGGHARGEGSSNAEGGVTIDLVRLNGVEIAVDKKTVKVGSGGRWMGVYSKLDSHGLTVLGGRVAMVGVGGFLLGGESAALPLRQELHVLQAASLASLKVKAGAATASSPMKSFFPTGSLPRPTRTEIPICSGHFMELDPQILAS